MARFCTNCGNPLSEGAAFCTECGEKVEAKPGTAAAVPVSSGHPADGQKKEEARASFSEGHEEKQYEEQPCGEREEHYVDDNGIKETFFRYDNRINRWRYFKRSFVLTFGVMIGISVVAWILEIELSDVFLSTVAFWLSIPLQIRRWHDLGKSGWWCITTLIPIVGAFAALYLTFASGDYGPNQYGPDPLEGRRKLL